MTNTAATQSTHRRTTPTTSTTRATRTTPSTERQAQRQRRDVRDVRDDSTRTQRTRRSEPALPSSSSRPPDRTARFERVIRPGTRAQKVEGSITVNGHTYKFRSGGYGNGNLPKGDYTVSNLRSRNTKGMVKDGVGFSADLTNRYDARTHRMRDGLRIHPDGNAPGTLGCIGIVGNKAQLQKFREDLKAELAKHGGKFTLHVR